MSRRSSNPRAGITVPILGYHRIGEPGPGAWATWFYIPEATFVRQLQILAETGWHPIDLATFLASLDDPGRLPPRACLLTFDDAHRSAREVALPRLQQFGHPAVVFVPSDFVGRSTSFDENEPVEPVCDWQDLVALGRGGVAIQSHGASHRAFSRLDPAEQEDELQRSRITLEARLGSPVEAFAYPYGDAGLDPDAVRERVVRAGYRAAFLYGGGPARLAEDPYQLPRIAVGPDTDLKSALDAQQARA